LAFSCEQKEDKIITNTEEKVTGEWIWVKSTYYNTNSGLPFVLTPDSVGYSLRQVFSSDGTYTVFKNDLAESTGIFWLETIDYVEGTKPEIRMFTQKENYINFVNLNISEDSLVFDNTGADGTIKLFLRIKNEE
jgi:hypothetical protein